MEGLEQKLRELVRAVVREELALLRAEPPDDDALLTFGEAAALVRVSTRTVRRWVADGSLVALGAGRTVRLRRADVLARLAPRRRDDVDTVTPERLAERDFDEG